jgi:AcrR family transcriptional regulator
MTRPPSARFERRKKDIVSSAVQAMNRKGVRGMTLADVATQLGIVPTGVIYYFKNKEELAEACFQLGIARYREFARAGEEHAGARDRIEAFSKAYFDFRYQVVTGQADDIAVFNDVRALNRDTVNVAYVDMFRHGRQLFDAPETAGLSRLAKNARSHLLLSQAFWNVVWLQGLDPQDYGRACERSTSILVDGLRAPGALWNPLPLTSLNPEGEGDAGEMFLRAATHLINEEGYLGASIDKISARLNLTKGAFYYHHETKDELVVACFERTFQIMRRAIRQAESASANGLQALATAAVALVECQTSGNSPLLRTSALTTAPESIQPQIVAKFNSVSDRFAALICDGVADGSIRPVDVNIAAQMLTAMINAAAELHFWTPRMTSGQAADLYVRPFFEGLLAPS